MLYKKTLTQDVRVFVISFFLVTGAGDHDWMNRRKRQHTGQEKNMGRPTTKAELLTAAEENYESLNALISGLAQKERENSFDFSGNPKKMEAHWKRDKNIRDIYIHLYEWHQLLLNWVRANQNGEDRPFLPQPYNWRTYGTMNMEFWKKHQKTSEEEAKKMLDTSHREVMKLAEALSEEELFTKGVFKWVGSSTLGSYFVSNTSSHYAWAIKKIKAHQKNCAMRL